MRQVMQIAVVTGLAFAASALAGSPNSDVVTFDSGLEGWSQPGSSINNGNGNPPPSMHTVFTNFGIDIRNSTNPNFIGDYGAKGPVTISIDMKINSQTFFFQQVSREYIVELRDFDSAVGGAPWASVWASAGFHSQSPDWVTLTFDVVDPTSDTLPAGWNGAGAEDPNTFEPILPAGVTYADVLAGVDQIGFTTLVPGFFFGFTDFDVQFDNISIAPIPAPGVAGLALLAPVVMVRKRRNEC